VLGLVRWGLVPSWTRDTPKVRPINARSETAPTSGMFRQALARRRCLVPADGFFEWQVVSSKVKQPYFFTTNTGLFAFAGIWERWTQPGTETPVDTCAILTTDANDVVKPVHARMPVILQASDHARWIDRETPEQDLPAMLRPYPAQHMQSRAVSRHVNAPANDDEACIVTSEAS